MNQERLNAAVQGPGTFSQVLLSLAVIIILYLALVSFENIYNYMNQLSLNRVNLMSDTYSMDDKSITIDVNPNSPHGKQVALSNNERSGPEFTYSFFLNIAPNAFREERGLMHIFHKGYASEYPLLGPGVFLRSDTNCLRFYMNTFKTWNTYVEVDNIPVGKWFHVAFVCRSTHAEVYINGNLKSKLSFDGYQPYQNYENVIFFSQRRIKLPKTIPSLDEEGFDVFGAAKGFMSRMTYFNYALSYTEINKMMNEGPSKKLSSKGVSNPPPYLDDTWWTSVY